MQENIVLKIKYNDDIRRVRLIEKGFIGLQKQIGEIYSIQQGTFTLKYKDDEGDLVTISSEEEFSESFKFIQNNILRLEITSLVEKKEGEGRCKRRWKGKCHKGNRDGHHHGHRHQHQGQHPFGFLHNITKNLMGDEGVLNNLLNSGLCHIEHNYVCDGCESKIRGTRYHCSECPDFDFCSSCFETKLDSHPEHKFIAITALDALKEAIGNGEQIDSFFEIFQPGQQVPEQEPVPQETSVSQEDFEREILEQERHKQQIEQERLEQERIQQEQQQEQERIKQEQERLEQERIQQEQEKIKQEQQPEQPQQEQPQQEQPQPQQPQQPNKTFFENVKDILFPLRNPEPVNNDTFEKKLEDLTSMGFDKKECIKALVQNKGNIQKAVDALLKKK